LERSLVSHGRSWSETVSAGDDDSTTLAEGGDSYVAFADDDLSDL